MSIIYRIIINELIRRLIMMIQQKTNLNKSQLLEQQIKTKRKSTASMKSSHSNISSILLNFETEQSLSAELASQNSKKCISQNRNSLINSISKENKQVIRNESFRKQKLCISQLSNTKDLIQKGKVIENLKKKIIELQELLKRAKLQIESNLIKQEQYQQSQQLIDKLKLQQAQYNTKIAYLQKEKQSLIRKNKQLFSQNEQLTIKITAIKELFLTRSFNSGATSSRQRQSIFFSDQNQSLIEQQKKKTDIKLINVQKQLNQYMFKYNEAQSQVSSLQLKLYKDQKQSDQLKEIIKKLEKQNNDLKTIKESNNTISFQSGNIIRLQIQKQIQTEKIHVDEQINYVNKQSNRRELGLILEQCIADKNNYIETLKKRSKQYQIAIAQLAKKLEQEKQKIMSKQTTIEALNKAVKDIQGILKQKQIIILKLNEEVCKNERAIQQNNQEQKKSQSYTKLLEQKCKQLLCQNERIIFSYEQSKKQISNLVLKQKQESSYFLLRIKEYDTKVQQITKQINQKQDHIRQITAQMVKINDQLCQNKKLVQSKQKQLKQNQQVSQRVLNAIQQAMNNKQTLYIKQIQQKQAERIKANQSETKLKLDLQNSLKIIDQCKKQLEIKTACLDKLCQKLINSSNGNNGSASKNTLAVQKQILFNKSQGLNQNNEQNIQLVEFDPHIQQQNRVKDRDRIIYEQKLQILTLKQAQETLIIKLQQITKLCNEKDKIIEQNLSDIRLLQSQFSQSGKAGADTERKLKQYNIKLSQNYDEINDKYVECFNQLQNQKAKLRDCQSCIKELQQKIKYQAKLNNELKIKLQVSLNKNKKFEQDQLSKNGNLTQKKEFQSNIKFLTEELKIWSDKYETVVKQNNIMRMELENYKGMYKVMSQNAKSNNHSLSSSKLLIDRRKNSCQKNLQRQIEKYKMKMTVLKQQNQRLESTMNVQLKKRKQIIEDLIREKNILYEQMTTNSRSS